MSKPVAVELVDVHKSFRGGRDHVLKGVSLEFYEGELTFVLGPSGTGKSVLIKHILGLLKPDHGTVHVHGKDMSLLRGADLADARRVFGMLFQSAALFDDLTVYENVAFPLVEHSDLSNDDIEKKVTTTLGLLGMTSGYDKLPNELSGGMRKRVGLARAIVREPSILLYDEPTTGLDPVTRSTVDELIATLRDKLKLTSIVVSHDIPAALRLADRIIFLYGGTAVFTGKPSELWNSNHPTIRGFLEAESMSLRSLTESRV